MKRTTLGHIMAVGLLALGVGHAIANPTGGQVASGSATITTIPGTVTINQASNIAIINWQSFSIASGELTKFIQPCATSAALNRVLGGGTSVIDGTLSANGQVLVINGNGIVIGSSGVVCANSFVGSTRDISDSDFLCGNLHFTGNSSAGVQNQGSITALGGDVALIGKTVDNEGSITATSGTVGLAAGDDVLLNLSGEEHVFVSASPTATSASTQTAIKNGGSITAATAELKAANGNLYALAINNGGTIRATTVCSSGGHVYLTTDAGMIQNNGTISAKKGKNGGAITITGGSVWNRNTIDVSGQQGGNVTVNSQNIQNDGTITAKGTDCGGGSVLLTFAGNALGSVQGLIDASGKTQGGTIDFAGNGLNSEAYLSLTLDVSSSCGTAGSIDITTPTLYLTGATLKANGLLGGGSIFAGEGDPASSPDLPISQIVYVSVGTTLDANATYLGNGGTIGVDGTSLDAFQGVANANGAGYSGVAGNITIAGPSSASNSTSPTPVQLQIRGKTATAIGSVSTSTAGGSTTITTTGPAPAFEFVDPDPGAGNAFGRPFTGLFNLSTGNTLITAPGDSFGGSGAGAVYLFSDTTGALLSTLRGNQAGDAVGSSILILSGDNFAVKAPNWNNNTGAVTFGNGATGFAGGGGFVSATNSLVGLQSGDAIGSGGLFSLLNGNILVSSPHYNGSAGAVTFVNPSTGLVGTVSENNSLVGATPGDAIGSGGIIQVGNGANYLVLSPSWSGNKGAITMGSDTTGMTGSVDETNSLVGVSTGDAVGSGTVYDPGLGYFIVTAPTFSNGAGAVTWSSDSSLTTGPISSSNSLVGSASGDHVGSGGITPLFDDHNFVVVSPDWNDGEGAVTLGNGSTPLIGTIDSTNSLVGAASGDHAGSGGITVLPGYSDFVVNSPDWNNGKGAVTLAHDAGPLDGVIGSSNSLVGAANGDAIGSGTITVLDNGNFLVISPSFNNGAGAVTFADLSAPLAGTVGSGNSLVGANSGDDLGSGGIVQLSNGNNYLVLSPLFGNGEGAVTNGSTTSALTEVVDPSNSLVGQFAGDHVGAAGSITDSFDNYYLVTTLNAGHGDGAVTWSLDNHATIGTVSAANSLRGTSDSDHVGSGGITILYDGNYVVSSPDWSNEAGAVTWGSATSGVKGSVGSGNSLFGTTDFDQVGSGGILQLNNAANFLVLSPFWGSGKGEITNVSSASGLTGGVSPINSLEGSSNTDHVGAAGSIIESYDGYYLVKTPTWNSGAGAVTWNSDSSGKVGTISNLNSLVGSSSADNVGSAGVTILFNGNYVVDSPNWNSDAGAITFGSAAEGVSGYIGSGNSLIGGSGDRIGSGGIRVLDNNNLLVLSPSFGGDAGAVTWFDGTNGTTGPVSSSNSLLGMSSGDAIGSGGVTILSNGNYLVLSPDFNSDKGAVTWGSESGGVSGFVGSGNSLIGANNGDMIGSGGIDELDNGTNYLVLSPLWNGTKGAITEGNSTVALTGIVGQGDSLVGASSGDEVGSGNAIIDKSEYGYYLVRDVNFGNGDGSITWNDATAGTTGVVSSTNSLVGANSGDHLGSGGIATLDDGNYLVLSPDYAGGAGAVTWGNQAGGVSGIISSTNSLVGANSSDHIGSGALIYLSNGNYLVQSPLFNGSAGAVTWGSETSGVSGVVSSANSITGGGPDSGEQYAGQSLEQQDGQTVEGSIYLISFTTDTSKGGDGRVLAGSIDGPNSSTTITTSPDFFTDPTVISVEASELGSPHSSSAYYISNPEAVPLDPVSVDSATGGALNDGSGHNLASGSSTSGAPGHNRLVTPGNGIWNIFGGVVHSAPPPAFVAEQLKLNLSPQVLSHLEEILFGHP